MKPALLVQLLREPDTTRRLSMAEWERVVSQARRALVLGSLADILERRGLIEPLPGKVLAHVQSEKTISLKQQSSVLWEAENLVAALGESGIPAVFLKGAAYIVNHLPASNGRLLSDIDILVPMERLADAESLLAARGWMPSKMDAYDQKYFRKWMHEIPPMVHLKRNTTLDMHHTILPLTAKSRPPAKLLFDSIRPAAESGTYTLAPEDMVIHSATHLFHDGELEHGLRDLLDIDVLINHFGADDPNFWRQLVPRAIELDLAKPLYYALHYVDLLLASPIPAEVLEQAKYGKPGKGMAPVMDFLFLRALMPDHPSADGPFTGISRWLLYVRSHYLRMPLHLLIPHLVRKAWKRRFDKAGEFTPVVEDN